MSPPDDRDDDKPQGPIEGFGEVTIPAPPPSEALIPAIPAGKARATLLQAEARLARALEEFMGIAAACARALDATVVPNDAT